MKYLVRAAALLLLMAGGAWAQSGVPLVPIRTGDHPGFGRVVFDLPTGARWTLDRVGERLIVRFSGAAPVAGAPPPRNVRALTAASGTAELSLVPGAQVRSAVLGSRLVLDVLDPAAAPAARPPVQGAAPGVRRAAAPLDPAQARLLQQAAIGDQFGGRVIPPEILKVLADPRIEPITAYMVWQAARKPLEEWTVQQLQDITAVLPTLAETGMPMPKIQALYKFLELDPDDVFHPQIGQDWQARSTSFDRSSGAAVAAISSADCQTDPGQMTVATLQSCQSGGQ